MLPTGNLTHLFPGEGLVKAACGSTDGSDVGIVRDLQLDSSLVIVDEGELIPFVYEYSRRFDIIWLTRRGRRSNPYGIS